MENKQEKQPGTKRFWVDVTHKQIDKGLRNHSSKCVVALAVAAVRNRATNILVDTQLIRFTEGEHRYCYLTPYAVQQYVVDWDAGDEIRPFRFQLRNPIKIQRARLTEKGKARMRQYNRQMKKGPGSSRGMEKTMTSSKEVHPIPPTVYRNRMRTYGARTLRINRDSVQAPA